MGLTRSELFSDTHNALAAMAKALAHPARVAIIEHLMKTNACINGDLVNELGLAQATVSQHLRELKEAGLIQGTIDGVRMCYCIDPDGWQLLKARFNVLFNNMNDLAPCCAPGEPPTKH